MRVPHPWSTNVRILKTPGTAIRIAPTTIILAFPATRMNQLIMPLRCYAEPDWNASAVKAFQQQAVAAVDDPVQRCCSTTRGAAGITPTATGRRAGLASFGARSRNCRRRARQIWQI